MPVGAVWSKPRLSLPRFLTSGSHTQGDHCGSVHFLQWLTDQKCWEANSHSWSSHNCWAMQHLEFLMKITIFLPKQIFWRNEPCPRTPTHGLAWPKNLMSKWPMNQRSPTDIVKASIWGYTPHKRCLLPWVVSGDHGNVSAAFQFSSFDCLCMCSREITASIYNEVFQDTFVS